MGSLLKLKTDLKSIKYGHDRANGGNSGQPYIQTDINTVDKGINKLRFGNFDDGLVRGGVIGMLNSSITDTLRIGKFLTDTPKGPLFIIKQVGLQLSNPRLESKQVKTDRSTKGGSFATNAINFISNIAGKIENAVGPTRIYNLGINTLAQVPINGIGGHIVRHGFLPTSDPSKYYESVVTDNNKNGTNRLEGLATRFELGGNKGGENRILRKSNKFDNFIKSAAATIATGKYTPAKLVVDSYIGGPGSVYGIGSTLIRRATTPEGASFDTSDNAGFPLVNGKRQAFTYIDPETFNGAISSGLGQRNSASGYNKTNRIGGTAYNTPTVNKFGAFSETETNPNELIKGINQSVNTDGYKIPYSHDRDSKLPERKNENDLVKNGPSSYPDPSITGSFKYTLPSLNLVYGSGPLASYAQITKLNPSETTSNLDYGNTNNNPSASSGENQRLVGNQLPKSPKIPTYKNNYGDVVTLPMGWNKATREMRVGSGRQDQINLTPLFSSNTVGSFKDTVIIDGKQHNIKDLVKFRIQAVNTDGPTQLATWMIFRAYITALSDSVDASWQDIKYAGRGDKFYIYDGFSRKMSVTFKVAALSDKEMEPMYQKLNYLMSNLMPDYENNLMRGPLVRMTIGNWIDGQLCKLDSLSYTIPNDSPWDISLGDKELNLPHVIEVTLNFTPIGSQTRTENKLAEKGATTSNIAQNWNGASERQYITDDTLKDGTQV